MIVRNRAFYMVLDTLMVIFSYIVTSLLREGALPGITPSELWYRCVLVICILSCHPVLSGKEATDETE